MNGRLTGIYIASVAKGPMQALAEVEAIAGEGLRGDRYCRGEGSYSQNRIGKRQVTLINAMFFPGSDYNWAQSRRNLIVQNVELMRLIGQGFRIGTVNFRGVKYCEPCEVPRDLAGKKSSFMLDFFDRGGLIAEILDSGLIKIGDHVIPPPKNY